MKSEDFINEGEAYYDKSQDYSKVRRGRVDKHAHLSDKEKDELQKHKSEWAQRMRDLKMYEDEPVSSPKIDSVESVKQHHPEIYDFFKATGSWMTFDRYGKVSSYHTSGQKFIVIELGPTAGMENSKAVMRSACIDFEEDQFCNFSGTIGDIQWNCRPGGGRGNQTETFSFAMPHADDATATYHDSTMEDAGEEDITSQVKKNFYAAFNNIKLMVYDINVEPMDDWIKVTAKGQKSFRVGPMENMQFKIDCMYDIQGDEIEGQVYSQRHHLDKKYSQHESYEDTDLTLEGYADAINNFVSQFTKAETEAHNEGERQYWAKGGRGMMPGSVTRG